ncbi:MAG TPA: DUF1080 domain-containing protein, partial [Bacteroidales bacterium]|nr:DUF1080 domain-containing protein [Bacteroidales bacterium]
MKQTIAYFLITLLVFFWACSPADNQLTPREESEGWELLFDGETLDKWKAYNSEEGKAGWSAEDGTLAAGGEGSDAHGYIITERQYDNFDLKFEWKIAEGGNSGVMYHVIESENFSTPYLTGPEYQLIDDEGYPGELKE